MHYFLVIRVCIILNIIYYFIHINIQDEYTEHLYGLLRVFKICIKLKVHITSISLSILKHKIKNKFEVLTDND